MNKSNSNSNKLFKIYTRTLQKEIPEDLIINWFICIASGNGQDFCSKIFTKHFPSLASTTTLFVFFPLYFSV